MVYVKGGGGMPEDFLGLFRSETDIVTLQPGQVLFEKGEAGRHMVVRQMTRGAPMPASPILQEAGRNRAG
jgi:hypothetical protein